MIRSILVSVAVVVLSIVPRMVVLEDGFLPENNMKIPIGSLEAKGINQKQFNQVMDRIEKIYGPEIKARGGRLVLKRLWDNATVNASAQRSGNDYILNMYGGLARHEAITQDGMALVVCHEMGHHLGGAPKYGGNDWASNEGQADYFANLKCLRRMFADEGASFTGPKSEDPGPKAACDASFKSATDRAMCVRGSMAGMSVTTLFRILRNQTVLPRFDTPDQTVVTEMFDGHPDTQCRLDTYYAGSVCGRAVGDQVDETDPAKGTCTLAGGQTSGLRPLCWYKPGADGVPATPAVVQRAHPKAPALVTSLQNPELWQGL
ncbi:MAG: hypothetical protein PHS14_19200 [Elusimicrobia bacterium]|nr:hypothetical protein [Elusimicrobiota bacterium]